MEIAWIVSEIIECVLSLWLISVWPWMKVRVNIINTLSVCITMSKAVIVPSLMMITSNSFWGIACKGHTQTHTYTQTDFGVVYLKVFQSHKRLWKQKEQWEGQMLYIEAMQRGSTLVMYRSSRACLSLLPSISVQERNATMCALHFCYTVLCVTRNPRTLKTKWRIITLGLFMRVFLSLLAFFHSFEFRLSFSNTFCYHHLYKQYL